MAGWPTTPSRDAMHSDFLDDGEPRLDPRTNISAEEYRLLFWQVAGMGGSAVKAWVLVDIAGALLAHWAVWNPNGLDALKPTTARTGAGVYAITWAATYPNEEGVAVPISLLAGKAYPQAVANAVGIVDVVGTVVTAYVTAGATGAALDANTLIEVR